jgi:AcrR family transcriptional regulator
MVYAYLGAKEDLFIACLRREAIRLIEAVTAAVRANLPPDEQLWRGLRAFFTFVGAHREGWTVLYRQARGQEPFAGEVADVRARMAEAVAVLLGRALVSVGRRASDGELEVMAYALVGASESLADWLADRATEDPERAATRMMNIAWLGADQLLRGATWRPAP